MTQKEKNIRAWNTPITGGNPGDTPKIIFTNCGSPNFDVDQFMMDDIGDVQISRFENCIRYPDQAAPEVLAYWRRKGLVKQLHYSTAKKTLARRYTDRLMAIGVVKDEAGALRRFSEWTSYVPVSAESDPDRRYPLIFLLHGGDDAIYRCETYGYLELAAEKEIIVIAPQDAGYANVGRMIDEVIERYPVDPARIYVAGFSGGAAKAEDTAISFPKRIAGAMMVGQLLRSRFYCNPTQEHLESIADVKLPAINIEGITEAGRTLPMNISQEHNLCIPDVVRTVKDNCEGLNYWLSFNRCPRRVTEAEMYGSFHSADPVERAVGTVFDRTHVERHFDRNYYFGDYLDDTGCAMLRVVGVDQVPHWPVPSFAEITWDFISKFSRDLTTGKIIVSDC